MNWETTGTATDYHTGNYPWDDMVKEKEYAHFTTFRKFYPNSGRREGWYRVTVPNWELKKMSGKLTPTDTIPEGHHYSEEAKRKLRAKRNQREDERR